jgi:hypothetical protein
MLIIRRSPLTGKVNQLDLPISHKEMDAWRDGELAQVAFPRLTPSQREFVITGYTEEDWKAMYPEPGIEGDDTNYLESIYS